MLPIIIGIGAALILTGCSKREDEPAPGPRRIPLPPEDRPRPTANTESSATENSAHPVAGAWSRARTRPSLPRFDAAQCNPGQEIPLRFALQDPRQEFCRLHTLLTGGSCSVEGNNLQISPTRTDQGLFHRLARGSSSERLLGLQRDPEIFRQLAPLEGLPLYLAEGNACELDSVIDVQNLVSVYSLLQSTQGSQRWREPFHSGNMGCILQFSAITYTGVHSHDVEGHQIRHQQSESHRLVITPAHLSTGYRRQNPGFPELGPDTPVSDCLVVR